MSRKCIDMPVGREWIDVPRGIAVCPRCDGTLIAGYVTYQVTGEEIKPAIFEVYCNKSLCRFPPDYPPSVIAWAKTLIIKGEENANS